MNKKVPIGAIVIIICIVFVGYLVYSSKLTNNTELAYKNTEYGFSFSLPLNWKGYSVINKKWEGLLLNSTSSEKIGGPEIYIRNPLWTSENPYQDIPIMIFTPSQWDLIQQEKISLGAAPIGPRELGRNTQYIFALPARYNYAFPLGFEEVTQIIDSHPLHNL